MREASTLFYNKAVGVGNHAFIEFSGLMNEYINLCFSSLQGGINFSAANRHSGKPLKMTTYQAEYLAEKFACIFGATFDENPKCREIFIKKGLTAAYKKK